MGLVLINVSHLNIFRNISLVTMICQNNQDEWENLHKHISEAI